MRRTPLIGNKAWFGPKRFLGWGWAPATWEGWACTVVILVVCLAAPTPWVITGTVAVAFALVGLKGTSPGGHAEYRQLHPPRPTQRGGGDDTPSVSGIVRNFDERDAG